MTDRSASSLSPEGARRRETMLCELRATIPLVHRKRRRRRAIGGAALLIGAAAVAAIVGLPSQPSRSAPAPVAIVTGPDESSRPNPRDATEKPRRSFVFDYVETSPGIVERYIARGTGRTVIIDDETLVTELAAINRPSGLVRRGDRVWLTADIVDEIQPRVQ